jgi:hypothetical protein
MTAATIGAIITIAINIAIIVVVFMFGRRVLTRLESFEAAINRWRILDLATRAESHATTAEQLRMASHAASGNITELESLARSVLQKAWQQEKKG